MLEFYFGAMNSGKSSSLIQLAHNYESYGLSVECFAYEKEKIISRVGLSRDCIPYNESFDFWNYLCRGLDSAIFIDEAQFLTETQVAQLACLADHTGQRVLCYGLRTDFLGQPFSGSIYLMAWADKIHKIGSVDHDGNSADFQVRIDQNGERVFGGPQKQIGDNYVSVSRKLFGLDTIYNIR